MSTATPGRRRRRLGISTKAADSSATDTVTAEETDAPADGGAESVGTSGPAETPEPARQADPPEQQDQEDDLLSNFGGGLPATVDPFAPQLLDRARLPDAPEERLAVYEAAIETSRGTLADTVTRARFRAEIEIGFVLDAIRSEPDLYVPRYGTIENYGLTRWGYKRSTMYELMDTAPIRLAAASGKTVSGNPDTKGRKAVGPPAPRLAIEAAPSDAPAKDAPEAAEGAAAGTTPKPVKVELSKSVALELVPVWRAQGEEVGLAMLAEASEKARERGGKITAALVRGVVKDWGAAVENQDQGEAGALLPSEKERREAVNKTLANAAAAVDKLVATLGKLDMESVPPLDHAEAERHAKAIRAGGRWLNGHVKIPAEVVDAELVQD
ncbi:hypothetical protein ACFV28_31935 [Streptomyces sp. NPDC059720]|uniref:hypothetical protein n=1 Tax=Streptomyces sp. NPDC059720 TaxID=3346924 RepID=UPI0036D15088